MVSSLEREPIGMFAGFEVKFETSGFRFFAMPLPIQISQDLPPFLAFPCRAKNLHYPLARLPVLLLFGCWRRRTMRRLAEWHSELFK
jgi:hypothetical protein